MYPMERCSLCGPSSSVQRSTMLTGYFLARFWHTNRRCLADLEISEFQFLGGRSCLPTA